MGETGEGVCLSRSLSSSVPLLPPVALGGTVWDMLRWCDTVHTGDLKVLQRKPSLRLPARHVYVQPFFG